MTNTGNVTYKPSGKITPAFIFMYLAILIICVPLLSFAYTYGLFYVVEFSVYGGFLLTVLCGMALGFLVGLAAKVGKARSPVVVILLSIVAVALMKYVQWSIYIPLIYSEMWGASWTLAERFDDTLFLLTAPAQMFADLGDINYMGVWIIFDNLELRGGLLTVIWVLEILIFIVAAVLIASAQANKPFSESADAWYLTQKEPLVTGASQNAENMKRALESGDFSELIHLATYGQTNESIHMSITVHEPPQSADSEPYFIDIDVITEPVGKKKKKKNSATTNLLKYLAVNPQTARDLINAANSPPPPPPPPSQPQYEQQPGQPG